jgi:hypothetical protein
VPEPVPPPPPAGPPTSGTDLPPPARTAALVDPALEGGLTGLTDRPARLRVDPAPGWSALALMTASAPARHVAGAPGTPVDEESLTLAAIRVPTAPLLSAPAGSDLLGRLRTVHRMFLPAPRRPVDASWQHLGGRPAVLDRLTDAAGDRMSAFSMAAALATDDGLVVVGWGPAERSGALEAVGLPLATLLRADGDGMVWARLPGWAVGEEVRLTRSSVSARVVLGPLPDDGDLRRWTDALIARAPRLRGARALAERAASVRGVESARLRPFELQLPHGGVLCTVVVTGTAGSDGFGLVLELPAEGPESRLDPDVVLGMVEVRPARAGRPFPAPPADSSPPLSLPPWPAAAERSAPTSSLPAPGPPPAPAAEEAPVRPTHALPPVPPSRRTAAAPGRPRLRGPRDRYLDAAVDRVVVAAVDVADGDPHGPTVPRRALPGQPVTPLDLDVAAVRTVLDAVLMRGWGPPLPWHGRMDVEAMAIARVGRWRRIADLLVAATHPPAGTVLDDEVWVTARLVATAAAEARTARGERRSGLAGVLERVRRGLEDPDGAWDDAMATVLVARAPRYRFATGFAGGSGRLLRAANGAARDRWGELVDHYDLPIPLAVASQVQALVDRAELDRGGDGAGTHPFSQREFVAFRDDYLVTLDELRRALGPAYVVEERAPRPRS